MADKILQSKETFVALFKEVKCGDFEFILRERPGYNMKMEPRVDYSLQIQFNAEDNTQEEPGLHRQFCRLWPLQVTMCDSEVIRTAYKASEAAMLHELSEMFQFQGEMIHNAHNNIYRMVEMRRTEDASDVRVPEEDSKQQRFGSEN